MRVSIPICLAAAMFATTAPALAGGPSSDIVLLKSGGRLRGTVMAEEPSGVTILLADGTKKVVPTAEIFRVVYDEGAQPPPAPATTAPPVAKPAEPSAPPPPPSPTAAPQLRLDAPMPGADTAAPSSPAWTRARQGLSAGIKGGGGYIPVLDAGGGLLAGFVNVGVGMVDYRFNAGMFAGGGKYGSSVGPITISEVRINFGSVYTLGAGGLIGASYDVEPDKVGPIVGAILTPAAVRFGSRRQFEVEMFAGPTYNTETEFLGGVGALSFSTLFI